LLFGYYVPGVRHLTAIVAGTSKLRPFTFGVFAYTGACLWVVTFVSIGYVFGEKWSQVLNEIQDHLDVALWIAAGLLVMFFMLRYAFRKSPRSWFKIDTDGDSKSSR
jgi:membrane protein DedA with SNARE-associated domain